MKRTMSFAVAVAAALALLPAESAAQTSKFVGVSGGASSAELRGGVTNSNFRWGGTAGLFFGYRTWRTVGLLEVNWVQKGGKDATGDGETRIDYIEVPFLVGGGSETGDFLVRVYTGIGVGWPISCSSTSTSSLQNCNLKRSWQWTWPFGLLLGRRIGDGRTFVGIDGRYNIGLSDTFEGAVMANYNWQIRLQVARRVGF